MSDEDLPPGVIEYDDTPTKTSGSVWKGIGVGIVATIILELFVGLAMDTRTNLVHRYAAYMMGIGVLLIVSIYAKSIWKMAFLGTPIIVGFSFVLPILMPETFSALMGPFINILEGLDDLVIDLKAISNSQRDLGNTSGANETDTIIEQIELAIMWGWVVDLLFAMIIGSLAAFGLVSFVKLFANKVGFLTIFTFIFGLVFFVIGVIVLPYFLVVTTGISQFGFALASGGLNLSQGFVIMDSANGTLEDANVFFDKADLWFEEADRILNGIEQMQFFALLGSAAPDFKALVDNMLIFIDSAVDLVRGVAPMFVGVSSVTSGIEKSMSVINSEGGLTLNQLTTDDLALFEEGIEDMKLGFLSILEAIPRIQDALGNFDRVNQDETVDSAGNIDSSVADDVEENLELIEGAIDLMGGALDVFAVLITDLDDSGPNEPALIHLIRGALVLSLASNAVGDETNFKGTTDIFTSIIGNLTIVIDTFDEPEFADFDELYVGNNTEVQEVRNQIAGIFEFVKDSGNIAIAMGNFGISATTALTQMNQTMSVFKDKSFDDLTIDYGQIELDFSDPGGILEAAAQMELDGNATADLVDIMSEKLANENDTYGLMSGPAEEFITVFAEFDLATNGANFDSLAKGLFNIMRTANTLRDVDTSIERIQANVTTLQGLTYPDDIAIAIPLLDDINSTVELIDTKLETSSLFIGLASGNFSQTQNMPQLDTTAAALDRIGLENIPTIDAEIDNIRGNATQSAFLSDASAALSNIETSVNNIVAALGDVNTNLKDVKVES